MLTVLIPASSPSVCSSISVSKPRRSHQRRYMRSSMAAQSCASVPPSPVLMVKSAFPRSYFPPSRVVISRLATWLVMAVNSASSSCCSEGSASSASSNASLMRFSRFFQVEISSLKSARFFITICACLGSSQRLGSWLFSVKAASSFSF